MPLIVQFNRENRWKRFEHAGMGVSLELYGPDTDELGAYVQRFLNTANVAGQRRFVATNWSRGIQGFVDPTGTPIPDTAEMRAEIFRVEPDFWGWVSDKLSAFAEWRAEGNANSGAV